MKKISDDKVNVVVYQEAKAGNVECGDTYYIYKNDDYLLFAIADGLGSGPVARNRRKSCQIFLRSFRMNH